MARSTLTPVYEIRPGRAQRLSYTVFKYYGQNTNFGNNNNLGWTYKRHQKSDNFMLREQNTTFMLFTLQIKTLGPCTCKSIESVAIYLLEFYLLGS